MAWRVLTRRERGHHPSASDVRFFETKSKAPQLETYLRTNFPNRDLKVDGGDCNELIPEALRELEHLRWAPTFAFVDPDGTEAEWRTLRALAAFKLGSRYKAEEEICGRLY